MALLDGLIKKLNGDEEDPAPLGMPGTPGNPNTGISGGLEAIQAPPMQASAPSRAPDFSRTMGFDAGKFADPNKHDFKYDVGRTLSGFDPKQGFTPEVIDALNKLDYGTFSGSGDKLSLTGAKNAKDAGDFANQDWIGAFDAQNDATKWNFGGGAVANQEAARQASTPRGAGMFTGSTIAPLLQGDAQAGIQAALGKFGQSQDDSLIQQLIAKLGGAA